MPICVAISQGRVGSECVCCGFKVSVTSCNALFKVGKVSVRLAMQFVARAMHPAATQGKHIVLHDMYLETLGL